MSYAFANSPGNPDAKPLYNNNILKVWNWFNTVWDCNDWKTWHQSMVSKYGVAEANNRFLHEWNDLATGSSAIDCRTFNTDFRDYMSKVGLLDALYSGIAVIAKPLGTAVDVATAAGKTVSKTAKTAATLIPIVMVVIVIVVIVIGFKYANKKMA